MVLVAMVVEEMVLVLTADVVAMVVEEMVLVLTAGVVAVVVSGNPCSWQQWYQYLLINIRMGCRCNDRHARFSNREAFSPQPFGICFLFVCLLI
jgi:hypothetical protein